MLQSLGSQRVRHGLATEQQQIQSDCPCKKRKSGHTETHLRCTCMRKDPVSLFSQGEGGEKVDILNHGEGSQKKPDPPIPWSWTPGFQNSETIHFCCLSQLVSNIYCDNPAAAAAKSLQSCPTLCDPIDSSPPGSAVPGILQARTLESVAISFSSAWKWKVKGKSLSRVWP